MRKVGMPRTFVRGVRRHGRQCGRRVGQQMAADSIPHTYLKLRDRSPVECFIKASKWPTAKFIPAAKRTPIFKAWAPPPARWRCCRKAQWLRMSATAGLSAARKPLGTIDIRSQPGVGNVGRRTRAQGCVPGFVPKNIITRSLGPHADVKIDLDGPFELAPGDTFLLCSDGLTGQVQDEEIGALLQCLTPAETARVLVDLANLARRAR